MATKSIGSTVSYSFGGSGGSSHQSGTSGSLIGGGQVALASPRSNTSVYVTFSGPLAGVIESGAALNGTSPKNGYQPTNVSIGGLEGKVAGIGAGFDVYYDRANGLALDIDISAILKLR